MFDPIQINDVSGEVSISTGEYKGTKIADLNYSYEWIDVFNVIHKNVWIVQLRFKHSLHTFHDLSDAYRFILGHAYLCVAEWNNDKQ